MPLESIVDGVPLVDRLRTTSAFRDTGLRDALSQSKEL